jgi:hypothetical protein
MSGVDFQRLEQMAQQAQMPPMQRQQQPPMMPQMQMPMQMQPMQQMQQMQPQFDLSQAIMAMQRQPVQQVQNPIFGGAIPMDFGLPQASQIPADFQVRQFTPGAFNSPSSRNRGAGNGLEDGSDDGIGGFLGNPLGMLARVLGNDSTVIGNN